MPRLNGIDEGFQRVPNLTERIQHLPRLSAAVMSSVLILTGNSTTDGKAAQNLILDRRLSAPAQVALARCLRRKYPDVTKLRRAIIETLRAWQLQGPPISCPRPSHFGRVVPRSRLIDDLYDLGYFVKKRHASAAITDALRMTAAKLSKHWSLIQISRYVQWSTFQPDPLLPFDGIRLSANEMRAQMGLDTNSSRPPLICLTYSLQVSNPPRFPTVAEAYSGDAWPYYFHLAPEGNPHGVIAAWEARADHTPRPETVHAPAVGSDLTHPLMEIR